jgi:hypothetical protein
MTQGRELGRGTIAELMVVGGESQRIRGSAAEAFEGQEAGEASIA